MPILDELDCAAVRYDVVDSHLTSSSAALLTDCHLGISIEVSQMAEDLARPIAARVEILAKLAAVLVSHDGYCNVKNRARGVTVGRELRRVLRAQTQRLTRQQ